MPWLHPGKAVNPAIGRVCRRAVWVLLTALSGCGWTDPAVTLESLSSSREPTFDARLLGRWHTPVRSDDRWPPAVLEVRAVVRAGRRGYEIVAPWYFTAPVRAELFGLGEHRVLEMTPTVAESGSRERVAPFHFAAVEVDGDRLRVSLLSMHLGEQLDRGGGDLPALHIPGLWVLTSDPLEALRVAAVRVRAEWVITLER